MKARMIIMFNKEQLIKLHYAMTTVGSFVRKSYLGKRYFKAVAQRLDEAKVETIDYFSPKQIEVSDKVYQELLDMYERGKEHENTACTRIGSDFTVLYFDVESERNPLHILAGHPLIFDVKQELMCGLWNHLLRFLSITDKRRSLSIGFDHLVLPKLYSAEGEVTEIFLQKEDEERFLELLCDGVMGTVRETTLKVQGIKYDLDFGKVTA
jgi:hypothetical protein